jgi:hypothetical protein
MMARNILTETLSEPLDGATAARIDIHTRDGNLTVGRLNTGEPVLASGTLEYLENQDRPMRSRDASDGTVALSLRGGKAGQPWFRLPWTGCNGATEWRIRLNPTVACDITTRSGGGNVALDLAGMAVTRVSAETGGGNLAVVLPDGAADLDVAARTGAGAVSIEVGAVRGTAVVNARSGAGNVVVRLPGGVAARIHATTGLGKAILDPRFSRVDGTTYASPDYDTATDRVEITLHSGAGNVSVTTK